MRVSRVLSVVTDNPVLRREMLALRRDRAQWRNIAIAWAVIVFFALMGIVRPGFAEVTAICLMLVHAFMAAQGALSAGTTCITRERAQGTWDGLVLTRMRAHEVILGKALSVTVHAFLPVLPAIPMTLLLWHVAERKEPSVFLSAGRGLTGIPVVRLMLAETYLLSVLLLFVALAVYVSVKSERASGASARAGVSVLLMLPMTLPALFAILGDDTKGYALHTLLAFLAVYSATGALVIAASGALPGFAEDYSGLKRRLGGFAYVLLLALTASWGFRSTAPWLLGIHLILVGTAAAVGCSRSAPLGGSGRGQRSWAATLGFWLLVHAAVLAVCGAEYLWGSLGLSVVPSRPAPAPALLWAAAFATSCVLLCGAFGCALAGRRLPFRGTAALAMPAFVALPAVLLFAGQLLGWVPAGLCLRLLSPAQAWPWAPVDLLSPTAYLLDLGFGGFLFLPPRAGALIVQAAAALVLLGVAYHSSCDQTRTLPLSQRAARERPLGEKATERTGLSRVS